MFVGHLGVSLAAKAAQPRAPLAALVAASFGLDLLWPLLLLAGVEKVSVEPGNTAFTPLTFDHYPWSHSLLMAAVWAGLAGAGLYALGRSRRISLLVAAVVLSHWILDFVTHRPDLPLWPGGPRLGLGLWNSLPATILVEGTLFLGAVWMYVRSCPAHDGVGRWAFRALVALVGVIWITQPWSPPPPGPNAVTVVALALWIFPWWAAWIERHRRQPVL